MRAPLVALLINAAIAWGAFSLYYWLVGPELSKLEAVGLLATGLVLGQVFPVVPPGLLRR